MTPKPTGSPDEIRAAAVDWVARCAAGMDGPERAAFRAWLRADGRHAAAFRAANRRGVDCDWAWTADAVDQVLDGLAHRARRRRQRRTTVAAAAAGLVLAIGAFRLLPVRPTKETAAAATPTIAVVAPLSLALPDGSRVYLKDGARVTTDYSESVRAVFLDRGTAHFQVVPDPQRPFVVRAGAFAVQAVGTAFAIDLGEVAVTVLVTEGVVRIDPRSSSDADAPGYAPLAAVAAGTAVVLPADTVPIIAPVTETELKERLSWRIPRLEFSGTPLREVVALMGKYSPERIELADDAVGDTRVSGILRADRVDALVESLQTDSGVRAERTEGRLVLRRAH